VKKEFTMGWKKSYSYESRTDVSLSGDVDLLEEISDYLKNFKPKDKLKFARFVIE